MWSPDLSPVTVPHLPFSEKTEVCAVCKPESCLLLFETGSHHTLRLPSLFRLHAHPGSAS